MAKEILGSIGWQCMVVSSMNPINLNPCMNKLEVPVIRTSFGEGTTRSKLYASENGISESFVPHLHRSRNLFSNQDQNKVPGLFEKQVDGRIKIPFYHRKEPTDLRFSHRRASTTETWHNTDAITTTPPIPFKSER